MRNIILIEHLDNKEQVLKVDNNVFKLSVFEKTIQIFNLTITKNEDVIVFEIFKYNTFDEKIVFDVFSKNFVTEFFNGENGVYCKANFFDFLLEVDTTTEFKDFRLTKGKTEILLQIDETENVFDVSDFVFDEHFLINIKKFLKDV